MKIRDLSINELEALRRIGNYIYDTFANNLVLVSEARATELAKKAENVIRESLEAGE